MRLYKFLGYIFRNMDRYIAQKNHNNINMKNYNSKMNRSYLLSRNINIPNTIKEKGEVVL